MFGKFEESPVIKLEFIPFAHTIPVHLCSSHARCGLWFYCQDFVPTYPNQLKCQWQVPIFYVSFWCVIPLLMNKSLTRAYDRFQGLLCVFGCLCPKKGGHGGRWRPIWIPFWWLLHSPGRTQKILEYGVRGYYMLWTTSWLSEWRSKMIQSQSLPLNVVYPWHGPAKWINQHKSNPKLCLLMFFNIRIH